MEEDLSDLAGARAALGIVQSRKAEVRLTIGRLQGKIDARCRNLARLADEEQKLLQLLEEPNSGVVTQGAAQESLEDEANRLLREIYQREGCPVGTGAGSGAFARRRELCNQYKLGPGPGQLGKLRFIVKELRKGRKLSEVYPDWTGDKEDSDNSGPRAQSAMQLDTLFRLQRSTAEDLQRLRLELGQVKQQVALLTEVLEREPDEPAEYPLMPISLATCPKCRSSASAGLAGVTTPGILAERPQPVYHCSHCDFSWTASYQEVLQFDKLGGDQ